MKVSPVLSLILGVALVIPVAGADDACRRLTLDPAPAWTYSGAWAPDGRLLVVDIAKKVVRAYDPNTGRGDVVWDHGHQLDRPGGPSLIQSSPRGPLLEVQDGLHALAEEGFDDRPTARLSDVSGLSGVRSVHSWAIGDEHVLIYGDHYHPVAGWRAVLGVAPLADPGRVRIVDTLPLEGSSRGFYTNAQGYLTAAGDKGYFLVLEPRPHVMEVDLETAESRELSLPAVLSPRIDLPVPTGLETVVRLHEVLASSHRPAALYAQGDLLYVLSRHPANEAPWRLTTYDPRRGRAVSATILPTTAEDVVVVPGEQRWAIIEKGPFEGYGRQEIEGAVLVPAEEILHPHASGPACRQAAVAR